MTRNRGYIINTMTIAQALVVVLMLLLAVGCQRRDVRLQSEAITDRSAIPVLDADDVTTLISDSGITRYRITTSKWQMYDKADSPYWEFPKGIYLEKFNEELVTDATVRADYAYYNEPAQLWTLRGNVVAVNLEGEKFETPLLYWSQKEESVYSDSSIVITKARSIIQGVGFRSNQEMTEYTILRPTGMFPIEE